MLVCKPCELDLAAFQEFMEPPEFQGLLYFDGLDSLGRPVVVINADAVAEEKHARKAAFQYLLHQLEPVVSQVGFSSYPDKELSKCVASMPRKA